MTRHRAGALLWLLASLPPAWMLLALRSADVAGTAAVLGTLGRLSGVGGLSFLLAAAILSCRVPGFDRHFGGLTKLWQTHHRLGVVAFLLLLAHPLLLAFAAATVSLDAAAGTLLPPVENQAVWLGWVALLVMMVFMAPSLAFFGTPEYQRWRNLHRLAAVTVVAGLVHTFMLARSLAEPWGTLMWMVLAAAAVASVAWRLVFSRQKGRLRHVIERVTQQANDIVELTLRPRGPPLSYAAGQFVYLTPYDPELKAGRGEEHPYTLSSAPDEPSLRIAIKDLGDASHALQTVAPGTEVDIEGPYGDFFPVHSRDPELWVAGGIGITPFLGRLRHLAAAGATLDAHLVYCVQDKTRAHFARELLELAERVSGVRVTLHYFHREGPLTAAFLAEHCPDLACRRAYICGPAPLLQLAHRILAGVGLDRNRIITEEFSLL